LLGFWGSPNPHASCRVKQGGSSFEFITCFLSIIFLLYAF
jgi:hypothetical protein